MAEEPAQTATPQSQARRARLVPRSKDDQFVINRTGERKHRIGDLYARLLAASWGRLLQLITAIYIGINIVFALIYLSIGDAIENARNGAFSDAFFFSVQTLLTIGYGKMAPVGLVANLFVTLEVLTGFMFFAVVTGLIFSRLRTH
jgi:inward rectifier potassium channel